MNASADSQNVDKKNSETLDFAANIEKVREVSHRVAVTFE